MVGCAKMGMKFVACAPEKYFPNKELIKTCEEIAKETGAKFLSTLTLMKQLKAQKLFILTFGCQWAKRIAFGKKELKNYHLIA